MTAIIYGLALIGAVTVAKWVSKRWRIRKDKGYDASRYGAF